MTLQEIQSLPINDNEKHLLHIAFCEKTFDNANNVLEKWNLYKFSEKEIEFVLSNAASTLKVAVTHKPALVNKKIKIADVEKTLADKTNSQTLFVLHNPKIVAKKAKKDESKELI
jgi:hypothetical protein